MNDIKILETDGIVVTIPGRGDFNIFGSLSQFEHLGLKPLDPNDFIDFPLQFSIQTH